MGLMIAGGRALRVETPTTVGRASRSRPATAYAGSAPRSNQTRETRPASVLPAPGCRPGSVGRVRLQHPLVGGLVEIELCRRRRGFHLRRIAEHHHAAAGEILDLRPL